MPNKDKIKGGYADNAKEFDFCSKELKMGIKVEMEHTDDPDKAKEIAMDHLMEISDYYTRLEIMENEAKKDIKKGGQGSGKKGHKTASLNDLKERKKQYVESLKHFSGKEETKPAFDALNKLIAEIDNKIKNYNMKKSIEDQIDDMADQLEKGGPGSGKRGHTTMSLDDYKKKVVQGLKDKGHSKESIKEIMDYEYDDMIAHFSSGKSPFSFSESFEKGGPGSGKKGHKTSKESYLYPKAEIKQLVGEFKDNDDFSKLTLDDQYWEVQNRAENIVKENDINIDSEKVADWALDVLDQMKKLNKPEKPKFFTNNMKKSEGEITMINKLKEQIATLGPEGLKKALPNLDENQVEMIKSILEEMKAEKSEALEKASKVPQKASEADAPAATVTAGKIEDTVIQEDKTGDDDDEKIVKEKNKSVKHQGDDSPVGKEGQVVKSEEMDEAIKEEKKEAKKKEAKVEPEKKVNLPGVKKGCGEVKKSDEDLEKGDVVTEVENKEAKQSGPSKAQKNEKDAKKESKGESEVASQADETADEAVNKAPAMKKSVAWEDENARLKAGTGGRNFHYSINDMYDEALAKANAEVVEEKIEKSENEDQEAKALDINDMIEKGMDRSFKDIEVEDMKKSLSEDPKNGVLVKSFSDEELAATMGMSVEDMKKILG